MAARPRRGGLGYQNAKRRGWLQLQILQRGVDGGALGGQGRVGEQRGNAAVWLARRRGRSSAGVTNWRRWASGEGANGRGLGKVLPTVDSHRNRGRRWPG